MAGTPVGSNSVVLEVLDRSNYTDWRPRLETYLLAEDLWELVDGTEKPPTADEAKSKAWAKRNAKALYAIQYSCGKEMFSYIREIKTATVAWETLKQELEVMQEYDENNEDHVMRFKQFVQFVTSGDWDEAKKCLGEVNVRSVAAISVDVWLEGTTALHVAAAIGHARIVERLVHMMAPEDLKKKSQHGHTALHLAAGMGHVRVIKELPVLLMGEAQDKDGDTALHVAVVQEGKVDVVKELVGRMRQEDLEIKNNDGDTALHIAVKIGMVDVIYELVVWMRQEGLKIENNDGDTPLHIAVQRGMVDVVNELVGRMGQEELKIKNNDGFTAFHLAVNKSNIPMVKIFVTRVATGDNIDNLERYRAFMTWVTDGDWDKANECLIELDDDPCRAVTAVQVDPNDFSFDTALHVAAERGHLDVMKGLLSLLKTRQENHLELKTVEDFTKFGAGISKGVSEGSLMESAKYMVEQYEITLGYSLAIQNRSGSTALHEAVQRTNVDVVSELAPMMTQEGLILQDYSSRTVLHYAVRSYGCGMDMVQVLVPLFERESLEIKDRNGDTALNNAVIYGKLDMVKVLVRSMREEGLEIKNKEGCNALDLAVTREHVEIVKELIGFMRPEAMEEKDGDGVTTLSRAIQYFKDEDLCEIVKIMLEKGGGVLCIPSAPSNDIPVVDALRWNKLKLARYIYSVIPREFLDGPHAVAFICYSFNARVHTDLAWDLLQQYPISFMTGDDISKLMMTLSCMNPAFVSGTQLTSWQRWLYNRVPAPLVDQRTSDILIKVTESKSDGHNHRNYIFSVPRMFRRIVKGLHKLCGIQAMYELKTVHQQIFHVLRYIGETLTVFTAEIVTPLIFSAIRQGNHEFVTHILKKNPALAGKLAGEDGKGIFHLAIEYRQKKVFSLIYELTEKDRRAIGLHVVNEDNNLLHYAANLSSFPQFDHILDASLQMQSELQWFKEVERVVPSEMYEQRNRSNNMTARELFTMNHKKLLDDAETSIKGTATSCTVVGALIVTVVFAAAFTVPGGNNGDTGLPLLKNHKLFNSFIISDMVSLVSSTSSVITFLGLLTSRYAEDDFLKSLPTKMMIGLITLFFSIVSMMIAFSCALIIMLEGKRWFIALSILLTSFPVILFVWLLFPLLIKTFKSTYGSGGFDRKKTAKSVM